MADAPKLSMNSLKDIVADGGELAKGTRIFDDHGLDHLSRFENKLFAEAKGSGASPYKVQLSFEDDGSVKRGRCSCMAARSRPFCKHSAALLVAWARAPEGFAVSDAAPATTDGGAAKKKTVKAGKAATGDLMKHGVEQVGTLVKELGVSGVASLAAERVEQVRALGESLRESKLRRLSAHTIELSQKLERAAKQDASFDAVEYTELLSDLLLTVRKLEKHLGGEALDDKYVEELIGKTWTKKDRKPIDGLDLVEYAFISRITPDDFVIRESRFLDAASGEHYSEKQIIPGFLAKRTEPKRSWAGRLLKGTAGGIFPSFSPVRLNLDTPGSEQPLSNSVLEVLVGKALPDVSAALAAFQDRRKDVFAPDMLPAAIAVDTILAEGRRMQIADKTDAALFLPDDPGLDERLAATLRGVGLRCLLGDIAIDGALPTFFPLAAIVEGPFGFQLLSLGGEDAAALRSAKKVKVDAARTQRTGALAASWADTARAAGASNAAISLGEVREEMSQALVTGLTGLLPRLTDPLAARLKDLGLEKQGALLASLAAKADPADRLDDFVKLYQILGIALTKLAGATHVDRKGLEPVPTYESVYVKKTDSVLEPRQVAGLAGEGKINRYQAAVHYARYYGSIPPEELAAQIYPTWADGSASPYVARAFAGKGKQAVDAARRALGIDTEREKSARTWYYRPHARVARITAVRVLEAVGDKEAQAVLLDVMKNHQDLVLRSFAGRAYRAVMAKQNGTALPPDPTEKEFVRFRDALLSGSTKDERMSALRNLVRIGNLDAVPYMRASFAGDVSHEVREEAAYALGKIGDVESVDVFIRMLRQRNENDEQAKIGAYALGYLGDVRGIYELLAAWAEGWNKPGILADSMRQIGTAGLGPLAEVVEGNDNLAGRKAAIQNIVGAIPADDVADELCRRLDELADDPAFFEKAGRLASLAAPHGSAMTAFAKKCVALKPVLLDKKAGTDGSKSLARKLARYL